MNVNTIKANGFIAFHYSGQPQTVICDPPQVFYAEGESTLTTRFHFKTRTPFNPRTYTQIYTPNRSTRRGGGEGGELVDGPPPRVFDRLQYFETILLLEESLCSSHQDEVYFMGGGAA